jgi:DNA-binding ferritin-like protein
MSKKRLVETLEMALTVEPNADIITDNMVSEWGAVPYAQLSVILVHLKFLATLHQTHHWIAKGDPFYGDHLLFGRLYDAVVSEIDSVAEKAVGLGGTSNVDLVLQTKQVMQLAAGSGMSSTIPQAGQAALRSYAAEMTFLKAVAHLVEQMKENGMLTRGLDNLLAGIEDAHEGAVYLLKQRTT